MSKHQLSEQEAQLVSMWRKQAEECKKVILQAQELIQQKQNEAAQFQGRVDGIALMIAYQQGLIKDDKKDRVKFVDDFAAIEITHEKVPDDATA